VGAGCSGKTHLCDAFLRSVQRNIKFTTRPQRMREINGKDYHFVQEYTFKIMSKMKSFRFEEQFNDWKYGTSTSHWIQAKIFIFPPFVVKSLSPEEREESCIMYLNIDEKVRRKRLEKRKDADSVERRLNADSKDFADFSEYDYLVNNPFFCAKDIATLLQAQLDKWEKK